MPHWDKLDRQRENIMRLRSLITAYNNLSSMPRIDLPLRDQRIVERTIWSLKQLIKTLGSM